jgi:hypothetical protein
MMTGLFAVLCLAFRRTVCFSEPISPDYGADTRRQIPRLNAFRASHAATRVSALPHAETVIISRRVIEAFEVPKYQARIFTRHPSCRLSLKKRHGVTNFRE